MCMPYPCLCHYPGSNIRTPRGMDTEKEAFKYTPGNWRRETIMTCNISTKTHGHSDQYTFSNTNEKNVNISTDIGLLKNSHSSKFSNARFSQQVNTGNEIMCKSTDRNTNKTKTKLMTSSKPHSRTQSTLNNLKNLTKNDTPGVVAPLRSVCTVRVPLLKRRRLRFISSYLLFIGCLQRFTKKCVTCSLLDPPFWQ